MVQRFHLSAWHEAQCGSDLFLLTLDLPERLSELELGDLPRAQEVAKFCHLPVSQEELSEECFPLEPPEPCDPRRPVPTGAAAASAAGRMESRHASLVPPGPLLSGGIRSASRSGCLPVLVGTLDGGNIQVSGSTAEPPTQMRKRPDPALSGPVVFRAGYARPERQNPGIVGSTTKRPRAADTAGGMTPGGE